MVIDLEKKIFLKSRIVVIFCGKIILKIVETDQMTRVLSPSSDYN